jgi:hypothetical protein
VSITASVNIPIGDIEAEVEISVDYEIEAAVETWCENNVSSSNGSDVSEHVENILEEYVRQQESGRGTCDVGRSFERAVEYAALKAFKKLLGG